MVVAANVVAGILIVRLLPLSEYALYVTASVLLAMISTGSDMGLSQGVNSLGARIHRAPELLSSLVASAMRYRRMFFAAMVLVVMVVGYFMFQGGQWAPARVGIMVIIVLVIGWVQSTAGIRKSVLHIHHNAGALFRVGMAEALARMAAVWICLFSPTAESALLTNLLGVMAARIMFSKQCRQYLVDVAVVSVEQSRQLRNFVIPLMPAVIYFMLQAQLSTFMLNIYGYTESVAEVGALGRLGQIISVLMMLNPFLIQPFFARLDDKREFVFWVRVVVMTLIFTSGIVTASGYLLPSWWLFILGDNYSGLSAELPLALAGVMASLAGATIYALVVSRSITRGQSWTIISGLGLQIGFIVICGITSTADALILNLLPAVAYLVTQGVILAWVVISWPASDQPQISKVSTS